MKKGQTLGNWKSLRSKNISESAQGMLAKFIGLKEIALEELKIEHLAKAS